MPLDKKKKAVFGCLNVKTCLLKKIDTVSLFREIENMSTYKVFDLLYNEF